MAVFLIPLFTIDSALLLALSLLKAVLTVLAFGLFCLLLFFLIVIGGSVSRSVPASPCDKLLFSVLHFC